jgi:hypothetical protein
MSKRVYSTRSNRADNVLIEADIGPQKKKSKPLLKVRSDENSANIINKGKPNASPTSKNDFGPKKLKLSDHEAHMNGAPEGDIYDVAVIGDSELAPLTMNLVDAEKELRETLSTMSRNDASWADRFNAVELIRRIVLSKEHRTIVISDELLFMTCLEYCLNGLASLRSSSVRNSILALTGMVTNIEAMKHNDTGSNILSCLLNPKLISSAPKFICEQAENLATLVAKGMKPMEGITVLSPLTMHRSGDVSSFAMTLVGICVSALSKHDLSLQSDTNDEDDDEEEQNDEYDMEASSNSILEINTDLELEEDDEIIHKEASVGNQHTKIGNDYDDANEDCHLKTCLQLLHRGLSARRPSGRDASRKALLYLHETLLGGAAFDKYVRRYCVESQAVDIQREMTKLLHLSIMPGSHDKSSVQIFAIEGQSLLKSGRSAASSSSVSTPGPRTWAPSSSRSATHHPRKIGSAEQPSRATTGRISIRERMRIHEEAKGKVLQKHTTTSSSSSTNTDRKMSTISNLSFGLQNEGNTTTSNNTTSYQPHSKAKTVTTKSSTMKSGGIFIFED